LKFADEDIEPQNFWASCKSQVATTYLCIRFCSNYIGWSNQGNYYKIVMHCAKQDVATRGELIPAFKFTGNLVKNKEFASKW
jgi:hypothetical protein